MTKLQAQRTEELNELLDFTATIAPRQSQAIETRAQHCRSPDCLAYRGEELATCDFWLFSLHILVRFADTELMTRRRA